MAMPINVSMSQNNSLILLMSRINVLPRLGNFTSIVVTLRYIIRFPIVVPQLDSRSAAYIKNKAPRSHSDASPKNGMGHAAEGGSGANSRVIRVIIQMIMLSIIPAISLRSQWSCS